MAADLTAYRRSVRPVIEESFPRYVEQELDKLGRLLDAHRATIIELQAQVAALTP